MENIFFSFFQNHSFSYTSDSSDLYSEMEQIIDGGEN